MKETIWAIYFFILDPPYSVQKAFFIREKAFVVETNPDSSGSIPDASGPETFENNFEDDNDGDNENDNENDDDYDDDFFSGAIQPRTVTTSQPRRAPRSDSMNTIWKVDMWKCQIWARVYKMSFHQTMRV